VRPVPGLLGVPVDVAARLKPAEGRHPKKSARSTGVRKQVKRPYSDCGVCGFDSRSRYLFARGIGAAEARSVSNRDGGGSNPSCPICRSTQIWKSGPSQKWVYASSNLVFGIRNRGMLVQRKSARVLTEMTGVRVPHIPARKYRGALAQRKSVRLRTVRSEVRVLHVPFERDVSSEEERSSSKRDDGGSSPPHPNPRRGTQIW
jgi:hypothetical protein